MKASEKVSKFPDAGKPSTTGRVPKQRPNLRMERGCVRSTSRSSPKAGGVGHVLNDFMLPTRCGWVFDHWRAPVRQIGSHPGRHAVNNPKPETGNQKPIF